MKYRSSKWLPTAHRDYIAQINSFRRAELGRYRAKDDLRVVLCRFRLRFEGPESLSHEREAAS